MFFNDEAMSAYFMSLDSAAQELAWTPEAQFDPLVQRDICGRYGIDLNNLPYDEHLELMRLANEYARM